MRANFLIAATMGSCLALGIGVASAQQNRTNVCDRAPPEKKAMCVEFLDTHVWDEGKDRLCIEAGEKVLRTYATAGHDDEGRDSR